MTTQPLGNTNNPSPIEKRAAPLRRNSTASEKGRASENSSRPWGKIFLAVILLAAVGGAGYWAAQFAFSDARLYVNSLHLDGGRSVTRGEVEERFSSDMGKSVLRVPLDRRRREVEQIPWVQSASVRRVLPNQLWVTVRERVPVAFLRRSKGLFLVDEDGVILDIPKDASFRFPVVKGIAEDDPPETRRGKMQLYAALMKDLDRGTPRPSDMISEVDVEDLQDARVVVADPSGAVVLHLGQEHFFDRYMVYVGHVDEWKQKFPEIQSIDLRYDRQVVINGDPRKDAKEKRGVPQVAKNQVKNDAKSRIGTLQ